MIENTEQTLQQCVTESVLEAVMPHFRKITGILDNYREKILTTQHGCNVLTEQLEEVKKDNERLRERLSRLERGVDQVETGLLVDKITVLEARLRDMEWEMIKLRERDEEVPSPWK